MVGAVLEQLADAWHPVEYLSAKLSSAERSYSATDREFLAIITALRKWRHYLANREVLIYTDHASL